MASAKLLLLVATSLLSCGVILADYAPMTLTIVNNCPYPVWPGIQANSGHDVLEGGGFFLPALSHRSFAAPAHPWSGRIWARTGCTGAGAQLHCATGDCGGRLHVVDGFNVGLSVTPHEGRGNCPVLACRKNLTETCPSELQLRTPAGSVVACKSGCEAFRTDELCCRNMYNSPRTCRSSKYSEFFKRECPQAFTYAHDSPSLTHECAAPRELKVIFCH
uniref:Osmotin-like protein n=1 Tax=Oryza barthii TaxID=65489 RepID=A0A0D3EW16_9ORYZ